VDERTARYYRERAAETFDRFDGAPSRVGAYLAGTFPPRSRVLDIGAGSGKDVRLLLAGGCDAYGIEPSDELRRLAIDRYPELSGRLSSGTLPDLSNPFGGTFDGILCSAVLMHLTPAELNVATRAIRNLLRPGGKLLLSVPGLRPDISAEHRDPNDRLYEPYTGADLRKAFESAGFHCLSEHEDPDPKNRPGYSWIVLIFEATD
jgi:SAM-dependent methyltransferase